MPFIILFFRNFCISLLFCVIMAGSSQRKGEKMSAGTYYELLTLSDMNNCVTPPGIQLFAQFAESHLLWRQEIILGEKKDDVLKHSSKSCYGWKWGSRGGGAGCSNSINTYCRLEIPKYCGRRWNSGKPTTCKLLCTIQVILSLCSRTLLLAKRKRKVAWSVDETYHWLCSPPSLALLLTTLRQRWRKNTMCISSRLALSLSQHEIWSSKRNLSTTIISMRRLHCYLRWFLIFGIKKNPFTRQGFDVTSSGAWNNDDSAQSPWRHARSQSPHLQTLEINFTSKEEIFKR